MDRRHFLSGAKTVCLIGLDSNVEAFTPASFPAIQEKEIKIGSLLLLTVTPGNPALPSMSITMK
jgi:hypothetical protein